MNYHKIEKTSIANGPGVRVVLWVSGCSLHCQGCHNPETWDFNSGKPFDYDARQELFEALNKPWIQGITFSGGHPVELENALTIYNLIEEIKKRFPTKDIWLYTGFQLSINDFKQSYFDMIVSNEIFKLCDVIVDGPFIESQKDLTLKWRGSNNQRVIDVKKTIQQNKIILYEGEN